MLTKHTIFIAVVALMLPIAGHAASCSRANLTRCLDSACAINVSSNPAARCQYCGTSDAGLPTTGNAMRSVSVGTSSKNTLSDKELRSAPDDPGERYAWATRECIKKLPDCTSDDVEDTYDTLIEQSCRAAGINAQMAALFEAARKTKTSATCTTEVKACVIADTRCAADYHACKDDADFDKFLSECGVAATGCDPYLAAIRTDLMTARDNTFKNADAALAQMVAAYQAARAGRLDAARATCVDNAGRAACIAVICARSMANKCAPGYESETSMATQLCKFYDTACDTLGRE